MTGADVHLKKSLRPQCGTRQVGNPTQGAEFSAWQKPRSQARRTRAAKKLTGRAEGAEGEREGRVVGDEVSGTTV